MDPEDFAAAVAAIDQLGAVVRDTYLPAVVSIEKQLLEDGASPDLAMWVAVEYFERLMNISELGKGS